MPDRPNEAFQKRQAQWDAFHRWESSKQPAAISIEERVRWYAAASDFSRSHSPAAHPGEIEKRAKDIQEIRSRLGHLKRAIRHG
jgi:hypothetical protein